MAGMVDAFLRHLEAFKNFAAASHPLSVEDQVKWRKDLTEKLSALPTLSFDEATTISNHLEGVFAENRHEFLSIVQKKVTSAAGSTGKNRTLQNWKLFPLYLFGRHWDAILDNTVPRPGPWEGRNVCLIVLHVMFIFWLFPHCLSGWWYCEIFCITFLLWACKILLRRPWVCFPV